MKQNRNRTKGHNFERRVTNDLKELLEPHGYTVRKGFQARGGGKEEPDVGIYIGPAIQVHVECKVGMNPSILAAMKQACRDTKDSHALPMTVVHYNQKTEGGKVVRLPNTLVAMKYKDWLWLLEGRMSTDKEES